MMKYINKILLCMLYLDEIKNFFKKLSTNRQNRYLLKTIIVLNR